MDRKPNVFIGFTVMYAVTMILMFTVTPIHDILGKWSTILFEMLYIACAVLAAGLLKWDFKEVFPVRKPKARQVFGAVVLGAGAYCATIFAIAAVMFIAPRGMAEFSNASGEMMKSYPFIITLLIVAVLPAICEEFLHRGIVLYSFQNIKSKWAVAALSGVVFGLFHLNYFQFLTAAIFGAVLAYLMLETKNILLPILVHFFNNALSVAAASFSAAVLSLPNAQEITSSPAMLGSGLVYLSFAPLLLLWGSKLIKTREYNLAHRTSERLKLAVAMISPILWAIGFLIILLVGIRSGEFYR